MKFSLFFIIILICLPSYAQAQGRWMKSDDPIQILEKNYQQKFVDLPLKGKLDVRPWSDYYWATHQGGISYRWSRKDKLSARKDTVTYNILKKEELAKTDIASLSPSEKYDLFIGDYNFTLTQMEKNRTEIMTGRSIPQWWGLCHDWAPATILYKAPGPITVKNPDGLEIPFYASDIKALLVYNLELQNDVTKNYFMGSRCELKFPGFLEEITNGRISSDKLLMLIKKEECADMDAGATHLALATLIGLRKTGLVMDKTRGEQIWNQPIYAYESEILGTRIPKRIRKEVNSNLEVVKILTLETNLVYIKEIKPNKEGMNLPKDSLADLKYKYEIFLNNKGNIIGGKWLSKERPDFFWRIDDPGFHPSFQPLVEVYQASLAQSANEARTLSKGQTKSLFKNTVKRVINAQRAFKNSKEVTVEREISRKEHYERLKYQLMKKLNLSGPN